MTCCNHWKDCPNFERFHQEIKGIGFTRCHFVDFWRPHGFEVWLKAINQDRETGQKLKDIGLNMGLFYIRDGYIYSAKGCHLAAEVKRNLVDLDDHLVSASLSFQFGLLANARTEAERLELKLINAEVTDAVPSNDLLTSKGEKQ